MELEHRGIKYNVVQTANPTGWRWTVDLSPPHKSRTGHTPRRDAAVRKAQHVIDRLGLQPGAKIGTGLL